MVPNPYGTRMEDREHLLDDDIESECLLKDYNEGLMQQSKKNCAKNSRTSKHERDRKFCRKSFTTLPEVNKIHKHDSLVSDKYKLLKDNTESNNEAAGRTALFLATSSPNTAEITSPQQSATNKLRTDDRIDLSTTNSHKIVRGQPTVN
jgi:hypothetical protein